MKPLLVTLTLASVLGASAPAMAASESDGLSRCLVQSSTGADRLALIQWLFAAVSTHPEAQSLSNLTVARRDELTKDAAERIMRLTMVDCGAESAKAVDKGQSFEDAFAVLGKIAMGELTNDPSVQAEFAKIQPYARDWLAAHGVK